MKKVYKFENGKTYALDDVYHVLGLIPNEAYDQDDPSNYRGINDNDSGETIRFTKSVTIKVDVIFS